MRRADKLAFRRSVVAYDQRRFVCWNFVGADADGDDDDDFHIDLSTRDELEDEKCDDDDYDGSRLNALCS